MCDKMEGASHLMSYNASSVLRYVPLVAKSLLQYFSTPFNTGNGVLCLNALKKSSSAKDTADGICTAYGCGITTIRTIRDWFKKFRVSTIDLMKMNDDDAAAQQRRIRTSSRFLYPVHRKSLTTKKVKCDCERILITLLVKISVNLLTILSVHTYVRTYVAAVAFQCMMRKEKQNNNNNNNNNNNTYREYNRATPSASHTAHDV
uniref:HTH_48 domain-containing protein n=1 Tax=Glossina pallidipes TaxID=7398 RepID=A0A1A9Z7I3_GLOPL